MNVLTDKIVMIDYKKPLVIYHGNCADGFSAAWVFHHMQDKIGQSFDFHAGIYGEAPPDVSGRTVYLVDFSYKRFVVAEMCAEAAAVVLIDHHKTAIEDLVDLDKQCRNFSTYTDIDRSGAMLAWDYWNNCYRYPDGRPNPVPGEADYIQPPLLLNHIQDRDLWKFRLAGTREISASVFSFEYTFENWDKLMTANQVELYYLQDARPYIGNDMVWWCTTGSGYATDLFKAAVYTKDQLIAMRLRETDRPWLKSYIDSKSRPTVDMQYVKKDESPWP